jgi:hypothetical protein
MDTLIPILIAYLPSVIEPFIAFLVALMAFYVHRWTGITIEAKHREALHSALRSGAYLAMSRGLRGTQAETLIEGYITESVPDALRGLAPSPEAMQGLIRATLSKVQSETFGGVTIEQPAP